MRTNGALFRSIAVFAVGVAYFTANRAESETAELTLAPYEYKPGGEEAVPAELGYLSVPENRSKADSRKIKIAFVRLKSTNPNPGPPTIYLAGGPGGSGIDTLRGSRYGIVKALREYGDVIALDQRGVGMSEPNLTYAPPYVDLPFNEELTEESLSRAWQEAARRCVEHFESEGVDIAGYTTAESADDIDALREALGYEKISLWGTSYGTHLAFATIRRHGDRIHKAMLFGIEGPDHTLKLPSYIQDGLEAVEALWAADPNTKKEHRDLQGAVNRVLEQLPVEVIAFNPATRAREPMIVGPFEFQSWASASVGRINGIRTFPANLIAMSEGDFRTLTLQSSAARRVRLQFLMTLIMDCASGITAERRALIAKEATELPLGDAINFPFLDICEGIDYPDLGDAFRGPLKSEVPVLFFSGTLDARTPIRNAVEMLEGFPNGEHIIIENAGHDDLLFGPNSETIANMLSFLNDKPLTTDRIVLDPPEFRPVR